MPEIDVKDKRFSVGDWNFTNCGPIKTGKGNKE